MATEGILWVRPKIGKGNQIPKLKPGVMLINEFSIPGTVLEQCSAKIDSIGDK
jgi:hypothetical protein